MKSLERRFQSIAEKNPSFSSYICFSKAIEGQSFNKQTVHRWFQKLVDKEDYAKNEKRAILEHLDNLSNALRTTKNQGKTAPKAILLSKTE